MQHTQRIKISPVAAASEAVAGGNYHAKLSPSAAFRWTDCTASIGAQEGLPNTSNPASRMGTCGHQIAAECLECGWLPEAFLGSVMAFPVGRKEYWLDQLPPTDGSLATVTVDEELVDLVTAYVNFVRRYVETHGGELLVEQSVPIGHITGEEGGRGTSDVVVLGKKLKTIIDLKLGRGKVYAYDLVSAAGIDPITGEPVAAKFRMNLQLALYALGSLEQFGLMSDYERVRVIIVQPAIGHVSEYECSVEELLAVGNWIKGRAELTRSDPEFVPSNKNCFFCKAKFDCHARTQLVTETCLEGFDEVTETARVKPIQVPELGKLYGSLDLIRSWCDDVEVKVASEVRAGKTVWGSDGNPMKFVEGRKGHKAWRNPAEVEELVAGWHLKGDPLHVTSLITPAQAEKLAKQTKGSDEPVVGPIRWNRLVEHIHQPAGKPTLALGSDPRPAISSGSDMPES